MINNEYIKFLYKKQKTKVKKIYKVISEFSSNEKKFRDFQVNQNNKYEKLVIRLNSSEKKFRDFQINQNNKYEKLVIRLSSSEEKGEKLLSLYNKNQKQLENLQIAYSIKKNVILTTFPFHKSQNVGDAMIEKSSRKMLKKRKINFEATTLFRDKELDDFKDGAIQNIIAPGFSVTNGVYPSLFKLYKDLNRLPNFFPIGCSFQDETPSIETFENYTYEKETLDFFKFITNRSGPLPCRDQLIVDLLKRNNIPAVYSGDLVLYDDQRINKKFIPPSIINSIVFTIPHHKRYTEQSFKLLDMLNNFFSKSKKYVSFHSKVNLYSQEIADYAIKLGFIELHLYGNAENLDIYNNMDLHVGYRLHGHISFLRRRKPTVLMIEDARAYGFSKTKGTNVGCIEALSLQTMKADMHAPIIAMSFIENQINTNFLDYTRVFSFIDKTYNEFINPYFLNLVKRIS